jgi:hypothetical protein
MIDDFFVGTPTASYELNFFSVRSQLLYHAQQAILIDGTQPFRRDFQRDPFILFRKEESLGLQIG